MTIKIYNRFTQNLICEESLESLKEAVIKNKKDLRNADLRNTNLWGANLQDANLRNADLQDANLRNADLRNADLRNTNLWGANLQDANLRNADLWGANLWGANLWGANLWGAKNDKRKILKHIALDGVGFHKRTLRAFLLDDDSIYFQVGCFSGSEEELIKMVYQKYGKNCEYIDAIKILKDLCKKYQ